MAFRYKETVEICSKEERFLGSYYAATLLAAVGRTRYLVRYNTRFTDDKQRLLTAAVDAADIRPFPPEIPFRSFAVSDQVDAYVDGAWWVGEVVQKVDPNYHVRLDINGSVLHLPFYRVRIHLEWEDGNWVYPRKRPRNNDGQAKVGELGS
ncbi:hypothetical protein L1049_009622 [Liquidambar formosana]|uniref:Agenet domain-containing protein n=1 Tax=Liquidambar formosana TaxID=63359 RepID=A0AAP0N7R6_LIQFO